MGMYKAAENGHTNVVRLCKENGATCFYYVYYNAALCGHIEIIELCKEWNVIDDIDVVLCNASRRGHTDIVKLSKEYGAVDFKRAYDLARNFYGIYGRYDTLRCERRELIDMLKEWKDTDFGWLMNKAAARGDIKLLRECKEKGAVNYNIAMKFAAAEGHIKIVLILKEWGADDFVIAAQKAARHGHIEILKLFKEWGLTDYDYAIHEAAWFSRIEILKLFREWGLALPNTPIQRFKAHTTEILTFLLDWKASSIIPPLPTLQS
jgi:hypothetical protein